MKIFLMKYIIPEFVILLHELNSRIKTVKINMKQKKINRFFNEESLRTFETV